MFRRMWIAALVVVGLLSACGGDSVDDGGAPGDVAIQDDVALPDDGSVSADVAAAVAPAVLDLPALPWWDNDGLIVDADAVALAGGRVCEALGADSVDAVGFFFRDLPSEAVGALCEADEAEARELLGRMYLSGWYGGLWFRDNADLGMGAPSSSGGGDDGEGDGPSAGPVAEEDFRAIADNDAALVALSVGDDDAAVFAHNHEGLLGPDGADLMTQMMDSLLTLYAYNSGYVEAIIESPPEGADTAGVSLPCADYLDCDLAGTPLAVYAAYHVALDRLDTPPDETWQELAGEVTHSAGWANVGKSLWKSGSITPEAWPILVSINDAYLKVTAVAVQASLLGAGDHNKDAGRCALRLEAAVDTWNRAYFLALRADAPEGTMPAITCP